MCSEEGLAICQLDLSLVKSKTLLFVLCLLITPVLKAQEKRFVQFGVRAGLNLSYMDFSKGSPPPDVPIDINRKAGVVAGLVVKIPLFKNFYFQPEYLYSQMGGEISEMNTTYSFNYFTLPVFIRWEKKSFFLTGGPLFGLLINSRKEVEGLQMRDAPEIEERHIGLSGGMGYNLIRDLGIEVRYMKGFNHVGLNMDPGLQEFKYEMLQISLCYFF